jgi:hypothetical protein
MGSACVVPDNESMSHLCSGRVHPEKGFVVPQWYPTIRRSSKADNPNLYDNMMDCAIIEQLFSKAVSASEINLSLLSILLSPGCNKAYRRFLKSTLNIDQRDDYIQTLDFYFQEYRRLQGCCVGVTKEFSSRHESLVGLFVNDSRYKHWRATEKANVLSAMNSCILDKPICICYPSSLKSKQERYELQTVSTDHGSDDDKESVEIALEAALSTSTEEIQSVLSETQSTSDEVLESMNRRAASDVALGSLWLVQYLTMMEDFPIACSLSLVEGSLHNKELTGSSCPIVYVNKYFEILFGQKRVDIVTAKMENCFTAPPQSTAQLFNYKPCWSTGFNEATTCESTTAAYNFSFGDCKYHTRGNCVLTMIPIRDPRISLVYIITLYVPIREPANWVAIGLAAQRNTRILTVLPKVVSTSV